MKNLYVLFVVLFLNTQLFAVDNMSLSDKNIEDWYQEEELIYDDLHLSGESESTVPSEVSEKETLSGQNLDFMSSEEEEEGFEKENNEKENFYKLNPGDGMYYVLWTYQYKNDVASEEINHKYDYLSSTNFNEDKMINYLKEVAKHDEGHNEYRLFFKSLKFTDEDDLNFFERAVSNGHYRLLNYFFKSFNDVAPSYSAGGLFVEEFQENLCYNSMTVFNLAFRTDNFAEVIISLLNGFEIMNKYSIDSCSFTTKLEVRINLNKEFISEIEDDDLKKIFIKNFSDLSINSKDFLRCFFDAFNDELSNEALNLMRDFALTLFCRIDHVETLKSFINHQLVFERDNLSKLENFFKWLVEHKNHKFNHRNILLNEIHDSSFDACKAIFNLHCFKEIFMCKYLKLFEEIKAKKLIFNDENEVTVRMQEYSCSLSKTSVDWEKVNQEFKTISCSDMLRHFRQTFTDEMQKWPEIFHTKEKFFAFCRIFFQENSKFEEEYFDQFFIMWLGKETRCKAPQSYRE